MNQTVFSFNITSTDYTCPLGVEVWHNNTCLFQLDHVAEPVTFRHSVDDDTEDEQQLKIVMTGKKPEHTIVDDQGNFVSDALLELDEFFIDDLCVTNLISKIAKYHHDFNGNGEPVVDKFFKQIGCNGAVTFDFKTPVYLWLLEHL